MILFSQPQEGIFVQVTCHSSNGNTEHDYHIFVYELDGPLKTGAEAREKFSAKVSTLGNLVETLVSLGHQTTDPIIRYAAQL